MTDRTPTTEAGRRQVEGLREAAQLCLRCGKVHVRQEGPTPKSAPSWADPSDGHTYWPESWEAVAHRLAATPPAPALDVERLGHALMANDDSGSGLTPYYWHLQAVAIAREYAALAPERQ